jgi:hypothetical protein
MSDIIAFPIRPLAKLRQVDAEIAKRTYTCTEHYRLMAMRSWCLQMIEREKREGANHA